MNKSPNSIALTQKSQRMHRHALKKTDLHILLYSLLLSVTMLPAMQPLALKQESPTIQSTTPQHTAQPVENFAQFPLEAPRALDSSLSPVAVDTSTILRGALSYGAHTPITITRSGVYRLDGPLNASANSTALTISANNVTLDLAGNTVSGGATGIAITGNNVTIKNGTVQNMSTAGIHISGTKCQLEALDAINSGTGFLLQNTNSTSITNCRALGSTSAGFSLISSYTNSITKCQALNTNGGAQSSYGFVSQSGYGNIFEQCTAQNTQTNSSISNTLAAGFLLANESASTIASSQAYDTLSLTTTAAAYGIATNLPTDATLHLLNSQALGASVLSAQWSPNGRFVAAVRANEIRIYQWEPSSASLQEIVTARTAYTGSGVTFAAIAWSPDGNYLAFGCQAIASIPFLTVYAWNGSTLTIAAQWTGATRAIRSVAWAPNGNYLAAVNVTTSQLDVFTWSGGILTHAATATHGATLLAVDWLDNNAVVIGGTANATINVRTYSWNGATLSAPTDYAIGSGSPLIRCLAHTAHGSYLAIGDNTDTTYIYGYSGTTLTSITSALHGAGIFSASWSDDGKNLVIGGPSSSGVYMRQYLWNYPTLTELATATTPPGAQINAVSYSPTGVIANGSTTPADTYQLRAWGLTNNTVIHNNNVHGTTTAAETGQGIRATTGEYVAHNTVSNNDMNYLGVASDYITSQANARGVYNIDTASSTVDTVVTINTEVQAFMLEEWSIQSKTEVINSKVDGINSTLTHEFWSIESKADVISSKVDRISSQLTPEFWSIESKTDTISSKIDNIPPLTTPISSKLDVLSACDWTPIITNGTTLSNKTDITNNDITLSTSGYYCLSANLGNSSTGRSITLSGDNITLDLNGHTVDGDSTKATGITITGNEVTVRNGTIQNATSQGLSLSGSRCTLENLTVMNCITGFYFNGSSNNTITNCRAINCSLRGFDISSSMYNTFKNCSAINNVGTVSRQGFFLSNSSSNSFDSCVVNTIFASTGSARGFSLTNSNYNTITNCTINGVSTTNSAANASGIYAPLSNVQIVKNASPVINTDAHGVSWLERNGNRYLGLGCLFSATSGYYEIIILKYNGSSTLTQVAQLDWDGIIYGTDWLKAGTENYLAFGSATSAAHAEGAIYQFTEPSTLTFLTYLPEVNSVVYNVSWLTTCASGTNKYYIALSCNTATNAVRVFQFTPPSTLGAGMYYTNTSAAVCTTNDWITIDTNTYLAVGFADVANNVRVLNFDGSALSATTAAATTGDIVQSVRWLATNTGNYYLAVCTNAATSGSPQVRIYKFDPVALTLTLVTQYIHSTTAGSIVYGCAWLPGIDTLNYLAIAGDPTINIRVLRFDGASLTSIYDYTPASAGALAVAVDWLSTGSTLLAAATYTDTERALVFGFAPTLNTFVNNTISGVNGGASAMAFAVDGNNLMVGNVATNNDNNYFYKPAAGDSNQGF